MVNESFEQAMAAKPEGDNVTDAEWYVSMVAAATIIDRLDSGDFLFCIDPPNPEIDAMRVQRLPPQEAAQLLFGVRH